jgi:signal transduction histidine kinase
MKLLQKTIRGYLVYSVFILLVAIPVFYLTIQDILRHETDEALLATKTNIKDGTVKTVDQQGEVNIGFIDGHLSLKRFSVKQESDSFFTVELYDSIEKEMIPYRNIRSNFMLNGQPYLLTRSMSLLENDDLIQSILKVQIILLVLLLGGLFLINRYVSIKIWRPFYRTLDKLRSYQVEKHPSLGLSKSNINEFDDLNISLEELTHRTHQAFIGQKEFTENASHEMQTPLAVFQSKLELLMQTNPLTAEQAGLIDEMADAGQRMQRLNKSLVLLTKIENNQFPDIEKVSVADVISRYLQQYGPQLEEKQIAVSRMENGDAVLPANRVLIEILVSNLIGNAIRHNYYQGKINIDHDPQSFTIRNTGRENALNEHKIFRRFQKESPHADSTGLGLEISMRIATLYGYAISYSHIQGEHCFRVNFKTWVTGA